MGQFHRTILGRGIEQFEKYRRDKKLFNIVEEGVEDLHYAKKHFEKVTILSAHIDNNDVPIIDWKIMEHLGKDNYPVFIMRDTLRQKLVKNIHLPRAISQWVYVTQIGSAIPINQKDPYTFANNKAHIIEVFNQDRILVIFPGATREFGPVNAITPESIAGYILFLKRNKLDTSHAIIPTGLQYHYPDNEAHIAFGKPYALEEITNTTATKIAIAKDIAQLSGVTYPEVFYPSKEKVLEYIQSER